MNFCRKKEFPYIHRETNIILPFYLAVKFIDCITSYISAGHFTDPSPFGNILEDSLPMTSWISKHFFNSRENDIKSSRRMAVSQWSFRLSRYQKVFLFLTFQTGITDFV